MSFRGYLQPLTPRHQAFTTFVLTNPSAIDLWPCIVRLSLLAEYHSVVE